jgi:hypothetical protein
MNVSYFQILGCGDGCHQRNGIRTDWVASVSRAEFDFTAARRFKSNRGQKRLQLWGSIASEGVRSAAGANKRPAYPYGVRKKSVQPLDAMRSGAKMHFVFNRLSRNTQVPRGAPKHGGNASDACTNRSDCGPGPAIAERTGHGTQWRHVQFFFGDLSSSTTLLQLPLTGRQILLVVRRVLI